MNALAAAVKEQGGSRVVYAGPNKYQEFCALQGEDSWDDLLTVARSMNMDLTPFEI